MIVYPAIDIRGGKVVRLQQGDPSRQTVYSDDPLQTARRWVDAGAEWLHIINLDGTLDEAGVIHGTLSRLSTVGAPIQFGGGIRTMETALRAFDAGARRVILGTMAVQEPELAREAVERFGPDRVAVALDARNGIVATHGWQRSSGRTAIELGLQFVGMGVRHALYTDISRDGELEGVNVEATAALASETGLEVIASGGVASLEDIQRLIDAPARIAGVVIGKALYTGDVDLQDALQMTANVY